jgi:Spy/CpxP family protein refolding chaperone
MRRIILTLPIFLIFALSTASAQRGPLWESDELGLSTEQQQKMEDMRFQHQKSMIQKRAQLKEAKLEMRNMMRKTEIDESAVLEKQRRISNIQNETSSRDAKGAHTGATREDDEDAPRQGWIQEISSRRGETAS